MAISRDGIQWEKHPGNPILTPTPGSRYDSVCTSSQCITRDGERTNTRVERVKFGWERGQLAEVE